MEGATRRRRTPRRVLSILATLGLLVGMLAATTGSAGAGKALSPRSVPVKPAHTSIGEGQSHTAFQLKLVEDSAVELQGQTFVSTVVDVTALNDLISSTPALHVAPMITKPPQQLHAEQASLEAQSGRDLADLSLYFDLTLPPAGSVTSAEGLIDALNALPIVELAASEPEPAAPPTPDFTGSQGYRLPAPGGIGATKVTGVAGAKGDYVQIVDIEYNWNVSHEDLSDARAPGAFIANGTFSDCSEGQKDPAKWSLDSYNHGTAVLGELSADVNGYGVTGIVPNAQLHLVNACNTERGYDLANAIYLAAQNVGAGDVILIEQQIQGPNFPCAADAQCGLVAVEYVQAYYDAIMWATAAGIIVVEPAGNGHQNLDGSEYATTFNGRADSGAIIVGAGAAPSCSPNWGRPARSQIDFSNYGAFVDIQGWGECVVTTGYGDLQNTSVNAQYTQVFGGTSSASPIVAGAAAAYSSAKEAATGAHPTSVQVRTRLVSTGTPQDTTSAGALTGKIGPLPNLSVALDTTPPTVTAPVQTIVTAKVSTTVQEKLSWSATDASGIASYELWVQTNGGTFVLLSATTSKTKTYVLTVGNSYRFFVRAYDKAGNASPLDSAAAFGPTFTPTITDDRSTTISYHAAPGSTTGSWAFLPYDQAYMKTITKSTIAGEYARYTFTGRDVAFVASLGTSRGWAYVYIDGATAPYAQVKLYSTSNAGAKVVVSTHWATSGTHTIDVQTVAVSGYPTAIDVDAFVVNT